MGRFSKHLPHRRRANSNGSNGSHSGVADVAAAQKQHVDNDGEYMTIMGAAGQIKEMEQHIKVASKSKITNVTVFRDRAEVTREIIFDFVKSKPVKEEGDEQQKDSEDHIDNDTDDESIEAGSQCGDDGDEEEHESNDAATDSASSTKESPDPDAWMDARHLIHLQGLSRYITNDASIRVQGQGPLTIMSMSTFTTRAKEPLTAKQEKELQKAKDTLREEKPAYPESEEAKLTRQNDIAALKLDLLSKERGLAIVQDARRNLSTYANVISSGKPTSTDGAALLQLLQPDSAFGVVDACVDRELALIEREKTMLQDIGSAQRALDAATKKQDDLEKTHVEAVAKWEKEQKKAKETKNKLENRAKVARKDATVIVMPLLADADDESHDDDNTADADGEQQADQENLSPKQNQRAAEMDADTTCKIIISYVVTNASWLPCYDLRANLASKAIELRYHGQVQQCTDEDWKAVRLTLSTAEPSIGGHPPKLSPLYYQEHRPVHHHYRNYSDDDDRLESLAVAASSLNAKSSAFGGSAVRARKKKLAVPGVGSSRGSHAPPAPVATSTVSTGSSSLATTFSIAGKTTVPKSNKQQKVTLAILNLHCRMRYFCVPRLSQAAYLQAHCTNNSAYPLLPSKAVNVFVDSNLVTTTELRLVVPGESFSAFLGVDSGVRVSYRPAPQTDGVVKGLFYGSSRKQEMRAACVIENLTPRAQTVVVAESFPQSKHSSIKIRMQHPSPDSVSEDDSGNTDDTMCGGGLSEPVPSSAKDKPSVIKNKYTNSLIWTCLLDTKQKQELRLEYVIEYPNNMTIEEA